MTAATSGTIRMYFLGRNAAANIAPAAMGAKFGMCGMRRMNTALTMMVRMMYLCCLEIDIEPSYFFAGFACDCSTNQAIATSAKPKTTQVVRLVLGASSVFLAGSSFLSVV